MKLYFFHAMQNNSSIYSKIKNQIFTFEFYKQIGLLDDCYAITDLCAEKDSAIFETGSGTVQYKMHADNTIFNTIYNWRIARKKMFKQALNYIRTNGYTHVFFRRAILDDLTIDFFRKLRRLDVTIIYEVPTFPYDQELDYVKPLIKKMDFLFRNKLKDYVDIIVTPSPLPNNEKIFDIDVMYIPNGIVVDTITQTNATQQKDNMISMIGVAGLASWHAYERVIEGLKTYYSDAGKRNIVFHIVGGNENNEFYKLYKKLIDDYSLQDHVVLHGTQHGIDLDRIFDECNVGIEALGNARKGIHVSSSLKTREYTARGLPVVASGKVDVYSDDYKYVMYIPEDESPVDISQLITFYDRIYPDVESYNRVHSEIRQFATQTCDMRQLMMPLAEYINSTSNRKE